MLEERGDKHGADSALDKHVADADGLASAVASAARRCEKFKDKLDFFFFSRVCFLGGGGVCLLSVFVPLLSNSSSLLLRGTPLIKKRRLLPGKFQENGKLSEKNSGKVDRPSCRSFNSAFPDRETFKDPFKDASSGRLQLCRRTMPRILRCTTTWHFATRCSTSGISEDTGRRDAVALDKRTK